MRPPILYPSSDSSSHNAATRLLADLQNGGPAYEYPAKVLSAVLNAGTSVRTFDLTLRIQREEGEFDEKLFDAACMSIERVLEGDHSEFRFEVSGTACDSGFAEELPIAAGV